MSVDTPKMTVAFGQYGIPQADIIQCRVHLGCTKEISSFELLLQNWDGKYSPNGTVSLNVGLDGHVDIGRGITVPQIIACRIESIKYESTPHEHYVRLGGRCLGERLFRRVFTGTFTNKKGEDIVKYLLDNYVGLSHTRDSTELVEATDTTYAKLEYKDTPVYDIIKYIAESADKQGVIGYDFRVAPDGKFEFFPRNSKTSSVSLSELIEEIEYSKDINRIRNKITVYGAADKSAPSDKDAWTESLTPADGVWSIGIGSSLSLDGADKIRGNYSVKLYATGVNSACPIFTFNNGREVDATLYPYLSLWQKITGDPYGYITIMLDNDDSGNNYAWYTYDLQKNAWTNTRIPLGPANEDRWKKTNNFTWSYIKRIRFYADMPSGGTGTHWIDGLFFGGRRYSAIEQDTSSQNAYGLRELVQVDEELYSDNECTLRAKALLNHLKAPAEQLTVKSTIIDYGNTPILPGDKIHITLPNEGVDADYRVESIEYNVDARTQTLEVTLELGRETPLLADYLYALRSKTSHLSRYKVARMI
ncbi:MAG: hypothetical protein QXX51_03875 [Candidatus Bathyarchaeia archaeon]